MKLQRKLTNGEWEEVIALGPGVHMFRGKKTFIYNGEKLMHRDTREYLERRTWEVIIVLPGVQIIPSRAFLCSNVKIVIMADTVKRIELRAFQDFYKLEFVRLSRNLEFIGDYAFLGCSSLTSIFIPPSCLEIGNEAFCECFKLTICHVPENTRLGEYVINCCQALVKASPFEVDTSGIYEHSIYNENMNAWIKNINQGQDIYALHRECASFDPSEDAIYEMLYRQGLSSFHVENEIGVTASRYLQENPFSEIEEQKLINRYVLDLMGEINT